MDPLSNRFSLAVSFNTASFKSDFKMEQQFEVKKEI